MVKPDDMALCARHELLFRKECKYGHGFKDEDLVEFVGRCTPMEEKSPREFQSNLDWRFGK